MAKKKTEIPESQKKSTLEFLRAASPSLLQSFELGRLNHVANAQREVAAILNQMAADMAEALLARMLLENRRRLFARPQRSATADLFARIPKLLDAGVGIEALKMEPAKSRVRTAEARVGRGEK